MTDDIRPALSAEEWTPRVHYKAYVGSDGGDAACIRVDGDAQRWMDTGDITIHNEYCIDRPHALAALCLYGQPFGFSQEDVERLERVGNDYIAWANDSDELDRNIEDGFALIRLASRIRALLPPEETPK
jgi:hypothetical protein